MKNFITIGLLLFGIMILSACTQKEDTTQTQYESMQMHTTNKTVDGFQISEVCVNGVLYYSLFRSSMSAAFDRNSHVITCNN